jgi:hypothetical protein
MAGKFVDVDDVAAVVDVVAAVDVDDFVAAAGGLDVPVPLPVAEGVLPILHCH